MRCRPSAVLPILALAALAACHDKPVPSPEPTSTAPMASDIPGAGGASGQAASSAPVAMATGAANAIDASALHDRRDPERLLRFYAAMLRAGNWALAAQAWRVHTGVTAATLRASYDRGAPVSLSFGKGDEEGAAGSIMYDVPVTLRFGAGAPQQGTLTLRRVNDVPGATPEQLDWRIERSTIGATQ